MSGRFHQASDIDRSYVERKKGGRGLRSIEDMYEIRMVRLMKHLDEVKDKHSLLKAVELHEKQTIENLEKNLLNGVKSIRTAVMSNKVQGKNMNRDGRLRSPMDTYRKN